MTASRPTFLLLLAAACFALVAGPALAEPVETPPGAPPAGAGDEAPEGPPPGAAEPVVETMKALPGRMPDTNGPKIPRVVGQAAAEAQATLGAWRVRFEQAVTSGSYCGRVVDQHPDAGSTLAQGEVVTLVVGIPSLPGRGYTSVPAIEGGKLEAGVAALRRQGFGIMLRTAPSLDGQKGMVLAQAPRPASVAMRGSKVIVVVGKGGLAEPVEPMPAPPEEAPVPAEPLPAVEDPAEPVEAPPTEMPPAPEPTPPTPEPTPPTPPVEAPPAPPMEEPVPPMPPAEEPTPAVEEPPAPMPVQPPKPAVVLRVPALAGPAAGESYPRAFGSTFTWGTVGGATTYEWELQVEAEDGTWSTAMTETVEGTSFRPKRLEAGRYRWRVRARTDEVEGGWSEFRRLYLY